MEPNIKKSKIQNRIRYCRMAVGQKQKDVAFLLQVDPTYVSK